MYNFLSQISQVISQPISVYLNSYEHSPIVIALLLGLIGAFAPCQLTGNISAITLYGNRTIQVDKNWGEILTFISGKVLVYFSIGLLAWIFGQSLESKITEYFPIFRKAIGPLLILTGFVLLGIIRLGILNKLSNYVPANIKTGKFGSFLLGASFAIAFCPTMFVLFFVWLMPTVVSTSYGIVLPVIFGIATSIPLMIILGLVWYFDVKSLIMKKSMKLGRIIQKFAGGVLVIIGLFDLITYWGL
ncbi:urease accessory protein UreH domain-containing protein [Ureibacillus chungkukjangi]|uniref:Cytochrome c biogenesis protein CcdA n=1 Tax=Ureibacillus chungkukjangi TaxID=1202712 RepID=A0A318TCM5_9BACL|nr:sulfite exporter TauE/SafE family protein [Ureibacillus chungkukjangi]PYF02641.1 cytochrome c biogenesis protein CcdA [Ureibacillus chungkukjangi]